jgi:CheY-like chemotaxis protein
MNELSNGSLAAGQGQPGVPKLRVLVVEDHRDTAKCLAQLLRLCGHEVALAPDGPDALASAQARRPDVVLLDIVLPTMDGYEVARRLADLYSSAKPYLIAVSGYSGDEGRRQSTAAGIDMHLTKPVDPRRLRHILAKFARDSQGAVQWLGKPEDAA